MIPIGIRRDPSQIQIGIIRVLFRIPIGISSMDFMLWAGTVGFPDGRRRQLAACSISSSDRLGRRPRAVADAVLTQALAEADAVSDRLTQRSQPVFAVARHDLDVGARQRALGPQ